MAKTLPIQIVKTRGERDFFNKETGGGSEYPRWATPEVIRKNAVTLHNRLSYIERVFNDRKTANNPMPLLLTAQINSEATAKSYRPNIRSIFDLKDKRNVIGIEDFTKLFIKVDSEEDVELIIENIQSVSGGYSTKDKPLGVAAVSDLTCFHPDVNIYKLHGKTIKVRLINYMSAKYNDMAEQMFISFCNDNHLLCKKLNYAEGMYVYKLVDVSSDNLAKIATMDSVISVKEMPYFEITSSCDPVDNPIDIAVPKEGEKYPLLGILDTGVAYTSHMAPWQLGSEYNFPGLEESDIERNHGTMVASVAVYGDKLNPECATGCGPLKYVNCIVNTSPDRAVIFEDELVEYVREAIQNNPDVKVWNLSQGSKNVVDDHLFSDFAMALDDIQKQYNVLICKSAGNATTTGERITQGAESVLSLTVGSVCNKGTAANDLPEGTLSPFSRIGLGPEHLQKPEVVHFGGNVNTGVRVLTAPDILYRSLGTSFSTPRVSALAAHLSHMLNQQFDATMIDKSLNRSQFTLSRDIK